MHFPCHIQVDINHLLPKYGTEYSSSSHSPGGNLISSILIVTVLSHLHPVHTVRIPCLINDLESMFIIQGFFRKCLRTNKALSSKLARCIQPHRFVGRRPCFHSRTFFLLFSFFLSLFFFQHCSMRQKNLEALHAEESNTVRWKSSKKKQDASR